MFRFVAIAALLVVTTPVGAQQASAMDTRLFPLQHMSNAAAAQLISPFVRGDGAWGVFDAGPSVRGVTVTASREVLARVDSLLKANDRAPATIVLRFQLIAAIDSAGRDPSIPADVETTLRELFRFGGYRLLAQGSATVGQNRFSLTMTAAGNKLYTVSGELSGMSFSSRVGQASRSIDVTTLNANVNLNGQVEQLASGGATVVQWMALLSTGLSMPVGQTVVLGSAAAQGNQRAIILTVRPEILAPPK